MTFLRPFLLPQTNRILTFYVFCILPFTILGMYMISFLIFMKLKMWFVLKYSKVLSQQVR